MQYSIEFKHSFSFYYYYYKPKALLNSDGLCTSLQHPLESRKDVQQKKEDLYKVLCKVENWRNRRLLMDLAVQVNPTPKDTQWYNIKHHVDLIFFVLYLTCVTQVWLLTLNDRTSPVCRRRLMASKWATNVVRVVANVSFATAVVICLDRMGLKVKRYVQEKKKIAEVLKPENWRPLWMVDINFIPSITWVLCVSVQLCVVEDELEYYVCPFSYVW